MINDTVYQLFLPMRGEQNVSTIGLDESNVVDQSLSNRNIDSDSNMIGWADGEGKILPGSQSNSCRVTCFINNTSQCATVLNTLTQ